MKFTLLSPQKTLFTGEVDSVTLPGTMGSFTVWKDHAALISSLSEGEIVARSTGKDDKTFRVEGGFAEVLNNEISVCVEKVLAD